MTHILFCVVLILTLTVAAAGQTSSAVVEVSGAVLNTSEEVIPGASVTLRRNDASMPPAVATSDARGLFRFSRVASGNYEIEIQKNAFKPAVIQLTIGARAPAPLRGTLRIDEVGAASAEGDRGGRMHGNQ